MTPWQVPRRDPAQEHQEFDSWRHQTHQPQQPGYNPLSSMASDPYLSSFYAGSYHYPGFGVGDGMSCIIQSLISVVCWIFTITEKAPTRAFSWFKAPASANAFTFRTM